MALVYAGECSFRGVNFSRPQTDGPMQHDIDDRVHYAASDDPYGDHTDLQIGGRQSGEVTIPALITAANLSSLLAQRRTRGTLDLHGNVYTATLLYVTNKRRRVGDYALYDLTFYV